MKLRALVCVKRKQTLIPTKPGWIVCGNSWTKGTIAARAIGLSRPPSAYFAVVVEHANHTISVTGLYAVGIDYEVDGIGRCGAREVHPVRR